MRKEDSSDTSYPEDSDKSDSTKSIDAFFQNKNTYYPLLFNWKFYFSQRKKNKRITKSKFKNSLVEIISFDNLASFWRIYNNTVPIQTISASSDLFIFKDYIKPEWEDIKNAQGGRWVYDIYWRKIDNEFISNYTEIIWLRLLLAVIGNLFEETEYFICGIVLSIRNNNNKICIWTCLNDKEINLKIGRLFKKYCHLDNKDKIYYMLHKDNPKDGVDPLYVL